MMEPEVAAFDVPALIWKLAENVVPSSLVAHQNCAVVLVAELRASCQVTAILPVVWSSAIRCRNWLLVPASSLTRTGELHEVPLLSEKITKMLVSALPMLGVLAYTK